jgi:hypothetical protein
MRLVLGHCHRNLRHSSLPTPAEPELDFREFLEAMRANSFDRADALMLTAAAGKNQ